MSIAGRFLDCKNCDALGYHTEKAGCIIAVARAEAANTTTVDLSDRLANVQPRVVHPVWQNQWEPELVSLHHTRKGAEEKRDHLRSEWCGDDACYHGDTFIGEPIVVLP